MAKAIFHKAFNFSSRKTNAGWAVEPSTKAQDFPRELIDAAVKAGVAKRPKKPAARRPVKPGN